MAFFYSRKHGEMTFLQELQTLDDLRRVFDRDAQPVISSQDDLAELERLVKAKTAWSPLEKYREFAAERAPGLVVSLRHETVKFVSDGIVVIVHSRHGITLSGRLLNIQNPKDVAIAALANHLGKGPHSMTTWAFADPWKAAGEMLVELFGELAARRYMRVYHPNIQAWGTQDASLIREVILRVAAREAVAVSKTRRRRWLDLTLGR